MKHLTFRDAPPGSYISEEGWLIVGQEAWTLEEWNGVEDKAKYANRYTNHADRVAARRRTRREYMRRKRAAA